MSTKTNNRKSPKAVLGVPEDATLEQAKQAHRKLVMKYHPDRNVGNEEAVERLKEVNEAYAELSGRNREPDNSHVEVLGVLTSLLEATITHILHQGKKIKETDLAKMMQGQIREQLKGIYQAKVNGQAVIDALKETQGKFSGKAAEILVVGINHHLEIQQEQLRRIEKTIAILERVQEIMKDCKFKFKVPSTEGRFITMSSWTINGT